MFKLLILATLAAVVAAQLPFNRFRSPLGLDPYYGGLGGNYYNGLGGNYYNRGLLGGDYYNRGLFGGDYYNRGLLGGRGDYYNRGLLGGDYYNRGLFGGDYYNRGLLGGRGLFNNYNGAYRGLPALRPPVIPPVLPPVVPRPAVIPPIRSPIGPIGTAEGGARIVSQSNDATADGAYQYHYETENGIAAAEQNIPKVTQDGEVVNTVQGTYSYVSPTGEQITVSYVADENGFQPQLQDGTVPAAAAAAVRAPVRATTVLRRV